jgi:hypothetical protein
VRTATALERLEDLFALADVNETQRFELRLDPVLAVELLEYAMTRDRIRNPAAFAVSRYRREQGRRARLAELEKPDEPEQPTLSSLELAWSLELPAPALDAIAATIEANGGFAALK